MIEQITECIDPELRKMSGKVFYSGRTAFSGAARVYVLGNNPGGDPVEKVAATVGADIDSVLSRKPAEWSAYCDESWGGRPAGDHPLQRRLRHLLSGLELDPRHVPASNLMFVRSRRSADLRADADALIEKCWPMHEAVLATLRPEALICLSVDTGKRLRARLNASRHIGSFEERNNRRWQSHARRTRSGLIVFGLTHPSIANWTNPRTDPSPMVRALALDM
jgi:hypothetical protein